MDFVRKNPMKIGDLGDLGVPPFQKMPRYFSHVWSFGNFRNIRTEYVVMM